MDDDKIYIKPQKNIGGDLFIAVMVVLVFAAIIGGLYLYKKKRGWYDNSTGPSENYQKALENQDPTLASLYDFQFSVNGYYFTVPMKYGEIGKMGFYDYPGTDSLEAGKNLSLGSWFIIGAPNEEKINPLSGRTSIWTDVYNYSEEEAKLDDCTIVGFKIGEFREEGKFDVVLPKGIKIGESTTEDVKKAYGRPRYEEADPITGKPIFKYEMTQSSGKSYVIMRFTDVLSMVEIYNKRESY